MSQSVNSKQQLDYATKFADLITDTENGISVDMSTLEQITNQAKYASVDRVYGAFQVVSTQFVDLCAKNLNALHDLLEIRKGDIAVGEQFVQNVKRALDVIDSVKGRKLEFPELKGEPRDGNEKWDAGIQSQLETALLSIIGRRKKYILELSGISANIEDEQFTAVVRKIGKYNEAFTNSWVKMYNGIKGELEKLGIHIDRQFQDAETAAAQVAKAGTAKVNFDVVGMDV